LSPNAGFRVRFFDSGLLFLYFLQPFFKQNNRTGSIPGADVDR